MIAASVKESERLVEFLLSKGADPNEKSGLPSISPLRNPRLILSRRQYRPDGRPFRGLQEQHRHRPQALREPTTSISTGPRQERPGKRTPHALPSRSRQSARLPGDVYIARVNILTQPDLTQYALHRAAAIGSVPMINLLVKHKSPLNATDSDGQTALHHAVAEGHGDAAVTLLKAGAETDKQDLEGKLALDLAPDKEVRKYIERMAENEGIEL